MKRYARVASQAIAAVLGLTMCAGAIAVGSAQNALASDPWSEPASFRLEKTALRAAGASPALVDSVASNVYRYFRMLAPQFAARTCFDFRDLRWRLPSVAVHGDAHVEQFVTTDTSYGLEDFDLAGFGPSVVDLVRYAASVHIACRQAAWRCDADEAAGTYFAAYRAALEQPIERKQPGIVNRLRADGAQDRGAWLQWAESLMRPMPATNDQALRRGWARFVHLMRETYPDRPETFYQISRVGSLQIGVGSALEAKIMIRIAGPTKEPEDDLILEARTTAIPDGRECVARPTTGGSLQVLMFTALLGRRLPEVFGFVPREDAREAPEFWIQSWDPGYRELSVSDLERQAELNELARDAATQLAGHFWTKFPEPLRRYQQFAQLRAFEMTETRAREAAREFAGETLIEWERFRRQP
jgi:Uncharacterized protein conserved in bacteria (DUF2252)